ncbi:hypothetical protein [Streptomyces sp. NWU339]|uniref:hypothetical protein n=1 Tax=Streptomyces sp. NWU339 TaxID=2185284 RepID=UPI0015E7FE33|nr:hypothetical protein [Streptomyces sp. NWU339]
MTATDEAAHVEQTRHVSVTLTFTSARSAAAVGTDVAAAVGIALPDDLTGANWHTFTLPASSEQQEA